MTDRQSGFSLIELIISIVVLALVGGAFAHVIGESIRSRVTVMERAVGVELARSLMEEILGQGFEDPEEDAGSFGTEEGGRALFDDVDDYDGFSENPPKDASGSSVAGASGYTRSVVVSNVLEANPESLTADGTTDLKRIEVTVVGNMETLRLVGLNADI